MTGNASLQGLHQEAKTSTSTTFPLVDGAFPCSENELSAGKRSPTLISAMAPVIAVTPNERATMKDFMW